MPIRDVMVFVPVYRLEAETAKAVLGLEWDGAISVLFQRDNPFHEEDVRLQGRKNILHQYRRGREAFLAGQYEAMLIVESDIAPPKDALVKLAGLEADLAYGVYVFRGSGNPVNILERYPDSNGSRARNTGESLSFHPLQLSEAVYVRRYACSGGGLGCVLVRRRVLEELDFRIEDGTSAYCDTTFTDDAYAAGFTMQADMSVVCGHIDPDGNTLWPKNQDPL